MYKRKDLLGLCDLEKDEILSILEEAKSKKAYLVEKKSVLKDLEGKSLVNLFYENSTRTRVSFEFAAKFLSLEVSNVTAQASSVQKGETLLDTGKTIDALKADYIVMRHPCSGAAKFLAENVSCSVINAGDGLNEHPTQALLDLFTILEKKKTIENLNVAIVGDILHSRVARSNIFGLTKLGANVTVCAPPTLLPKGIEQMGVQATYHVEEAIKDKDVIIGLRIQLERQKSGLFASLGEYSKFFGINEKRLKLAKEDVIVMHPGPMNRGVEISSDVADCENSVITEQVTNGLAVRMAVLKLLSREGK